jgi:alpha-D-ribose 1-methylphosphonate 5-triphosphate synthase subunit PhnG
MPFSQSEYLSILSHAPSEAVKIIAEGLLKDVGHIDVLVNRTGLVMLPYTDNAQGTIFHLGEVLVAEAHVKIKNSIEGYGMCLGRDLVQALAIAIIDASLVANIQTAKIEAFLSQQQHAQAQSDQDLLRAVETTRVEMETF